MRNSLRILIFTTLGASLAAGFFPQLYNWLALSWVGIERFYFWQLITYIFLEQRPVSLSFFIQLGFNMYVLWMFGAALLEQRSPRTFFALYFGASLAGALAVLPFPHFFLVGSTNAVFATLVAWMLRNPESKLLLFFAIPFKAGWLILGLIGFTLFTDLVSGQWAAAASLAAASLYGYFFTLFVFRQPSPLSPFRRFEKMILRLFEKKQGEAPNTSKIYDIQSGERILDDDQFMDAMLDRISRHGAESLTPEKKRMKRISESKK